MKRTGRIALLIAAFAFAVIPLLSQTTSAKPSFEVVSIKPSPANLGIRGGGPRGDRYTMSGASLRMLAQVAYQRANNTGAIGGQLQIVGGPTWIDSDRFEVQAKADCSAGPIPREQMQLMLQSMLEDRFQLKAHLEPRELPIYNLVVAKDGPKLKMSADQTPSTFAAGPPQICAPSPNFPAFPPLPPPGQRGGPSDPNFQMPRGALMMMMNPSGMTMQATAVPLSNLINMLQQSVGRPIVDKTELKGLFDFKMQFSPEGLTFPAPPGGLPLPGPAPVAPGAPGATPTAADPIPSLFTAIQDLGLRLESSKGPVEVLVIESAQKPTEN